MDVLFKESVVEITIRFKCSGRVAKYSYYEKEGMSVGNDSFTIDLTDEERSEFEKHIDENGI